LPSWLPSSTSRLARAVLLVREVLAWPAAEVADALGTTVPAVNSALQRARTQLEEASTREDDVLEPGDPVLREVLERYMRAFEEADASALVESCGRT
jgi:RNA polymerase sigma-70 factor (ECF subfamily)